MRDGGAMLAAGGELEMGLGAGNLEEHAVVTVVTAEAADLHEAQAVAVEAHQLVQALGVARDPQLHQAGRVARREGIS